MSYGLYKGSGKPSALLMAAFDKKEKEKKKRNEKRRFDHDDTW